jgi:hypothetical protein
MIRMPLAALVPLIVLGPLIGWGPLGCSSPSGGATLGTEEATALPPIKVDLPPPPSFAEENQPREYPDGTVSVFGLRKTMDKYLSKDVKVKAYLLEIYQCPVCPKGQTCKLCDQPHFFVSDQPNGKKEKSLMVVDYLMPKQKPPFMTIGKQYTIQGTFSRNSPTGFGDSNGLLQFTRMTDDKNMEFVSPAAALEAQALKGEAEEAAKLQKAQATKNKALQK